MCFVKKGEVIDWLAVIFCGVVGIRVHDKCVSELRAGQLVGGTSFIADQAAGADVTAVERVRLVYWSKSELKKFLAENSEVRAAFQDSLGLDLSNRIRTAWEL